MKPIKFVLFLSAYLFLSMFQNSSAQIVNTRPSELPDSLKQDPEWVIFTSDFNGLKSFTYQRITQQYLTNENQYYLDTKIDTSYLIFKEDSLRANTFHAQYYADPQGNKPFLKGSKMERLPLHIELDNQGKVKQLVNWKMYRDEFMVGLSAQVKSNLINSTLFNEKKEELNNEEVIRSMVMEDLLYLFGFYGDTLNMNAEYLRVKRMTSPFSNENLEVLGNLKLEYPFGSKNTIKLSAQNKAGALDKQKLLQECVQYYKARNPDDMSRTEITNVSLNSEQEYRYNVKGNIMVIATFSDVLVVNWQSRGNIRSFVFYDYKEKTEAERLASSKKPLNGDNRSKAKNGSSAGNGINGSKKGKSSSDSTKAVIKTNKKSPKTTNK
jgi:hypothetical protein